jgi:YD repeat-containing protein
MSTRATYRIKPACDWQTAATIYIHHDGYEAGAAHYLASMLACDNDRGGWVCMFIRANDGAELTERHEAHGDTEYRYDLDEKARSVTMYKRVWDGSGVGFENARFPKAGKYDVLDFITKFAKWETTPREFASLQGRYLPKAKALAWVEQQLTYAQSAYFQGWLGNSAGALADVQRHEILLTPNQRNICKALDEALKTRFAA